MHRLVHRSNCKRTAFGSSSVWPKRLAMGFLVCVRLVVCIMHSMTNIYRTNLVTIRSIHRYTSGESVRLLIVAAWSQCQRDSIFQSHSILDFIWTCGLVYYRIKYSGSYHTKCWTLLASAFVSLRAVNRQSFSHSFANRPLNKCWYIYSSALTLALGRKRRKPNKILNRWQCFRPQKRHRKNAIDLNSIKLMINASHCSLRRFIALPQKEKYPIAIWHISLDSLTRASSHDKMFDTSKRKRDISNGEINSSRYLSPNFFYAINANSAKQDNRRCFHTLEYLLIPRTDKNSGICEEVTKSRCDNIPRKW